MSAGSDRADRLPGLVRERELDWLLVTNLVNVRWLSGFTGTSGACLVSEQERLLFTDFRYTELAAEQAPDFDCVEVERELLAGVAKRASGRVGFDDRHLTVKAHARLGELVDDGAELVAASGLVEKLRAVKDADERDAIRAAAAIGDELYDGLRGGGLAGRTELEVARWIEAEARARGAEPAFPPIVATRENGARPHAEPREVEIGAG